MLQVIKTRRRRAIVLLVSLFLAVLIVMFIMAASTLLPGRGNQVTHFAEQDASLAACESGYQYALARLQQDPAWRGEANATVVNAGSMTVVEDRGNVYGFMTDKAGNQSQFRIRFNFHNGNSLPDEATSGSNKKDPVNPKLQPLTPYVSFNNLTQPTPAILYRAENVGGVWKVLPTSPQPFAIPRATCILYVEGLAGEGMAGTSPANPEPGSFNRRVIHQVSENYITRQLLGNVDAAVYGAAGINATLPNGGIVKVEALGGALAKIRSLTEVNVDSVGNISAYDSPLGDVVIDTNVSKKFQVNGLDSVAPSPKRETAAQQNKKWLKLKWSQIPKAAPTGPSVRAGTYVWRQTDPLDTNTRHLDYYPQNFDGVTIPPVGGATMTFDSSNVNTMLLVGSGSASIDLKNKIMKMRFAKDVYVQPQGAVTDFAVISDPADPSLVTERPLESFRAPTTSTTGPILTNDSGNIYFAASVDGQGGVTSGGNLTFQGASFFETNSNSTVALYSKSDIKILPIPPAVAAALPVPSPGNGGEGGSEGEGAPPALPNILNGLPLPFGAAKATDVAFSGIIFAMGNFTTDLGSGPGAGNLYVRGALSAYGGDPDAGQSPGAVANSGLVSVGAGNAHFVFDPAYFGQNQNLTAPGPLTRSMWAIAP